MLGKLYNLLWATNVLDVVGVLEVASPRRAGIVLSQVSPLQLLSLHFYALITHGAKI